MIEGCHASGVLVAQSVRIRQLLVLLQELVLLADGSAIGVGHRAQQRREILDPDPPARFGQHAANALERFLGRDVLHEPLAHIRLSSGVMLLAPLLVSPPCCHLAPGHARLSVMRFFGPRAGATENPADGRLGEDNIAFDQSRGYAMPTTQVRVTLDDLDDHIEHLGFPARSFRSSLVRARRRHREIGIEGLEPSIKSGWRYARCASIPGNRRTGAGHLDCFLSRDFCYRLRRNS